MKTFNTARSIGAALAFAAATALMAGTTAANAWSQQATDAQMDNETNYRTTGGYRDAVTPRFPAGVYNSVDAPARRFDLPAGTPQRDFQLEGR